MNKGFERPEQQPGAEECPHGCGPIMSRTRHREPEHVSLLCNRCGWESDTNPRVFTEAEAIEEVVDAARSVSGRIHRSDESFAVDDMYRTPAQKLRSQAATMEARDAALRRMAYAITRLDNIRARSAPEGVSSGSSGGGER